MTIENQNLTIAAREKRDALIREALEDEDFLDKRGRIRVKRLTKYDDPGRFDQQFENVVREVKTAVIDVDAKLVEGGRVNHYRNAQEFLKSPTVQRRLREARAAGVLGRDAEAIARHTLERRMQARQLREGADFEYGLYPDEVNYTGTKVFPITDVALPGLNSPQSKNALYHDVQDALRKNWEAYTFNPLARRIAKLISQFVLGRGVKGEITSAEHQKAWDDFWKRNRMRQRVKQTLREIVIYGEVFWRFFKTPEGLVVRALDPSTIWDIVTDDEDIENVKYYHQQFMKFSAPIAPGSMPVPATMVIRQIPADEVAHYKVNATSSEKRGRSDLFPILGYLLRFKEFMNDRILLNKMRAMFALDVAVEGDETDVSRAEEQFATPPGPAAVLVHNASVAVEFKNTSANANDAATDAEMLLKVIAVGAGISENFLGVSRAQTRAGALISTEPDVKNFEDYQELVEEILMDTAERVFKSKGLAADKPMEFTFPSIAQEDRSAKLKDIAFGESMDYFAKERAANMAAREFQISDYDYDREQQTIKQERKGPIEPVMATGLQQVPKIAPAEPGGETPGLGADLKPNADDTDRVKQLSGEMGFKADGGGRGITNTQATLNRPNFTRGGEKTAIKNNRSSGTPLRHSAEGASKRGWSAEARAKSLAVRRARAELRKREQGQ